MSARKRTKTDEKRETGVPEAALARTGELGAEEAGGLVQLLLEGDEAAVVLALVADLHTRRHARDRRGERRTGMSQSLLSPTRRRAHAGDAARKQHGQVQFRVQRSLPTDGRSTQLSPNPATLQAGSNAHAKPQAEHPRTSQPACPLAVEAAVRRGVARTIMTLETPGRYFLTASSIGTGATFSPPAVISSSCTAEQRQWVRWGDRVGRRLI